MGRAISRKNVPRGTLLWNRNSQNIVHVDNYFWKQVVIMWIRCLATAFCLYKKITLPMRTPEQELRG